MNWGIRAAAGKTVRKERRRGLGKAINMTQKRPNVKNPTHHYLATTKWKEGNQRLTWCSPWCSPASGVVAQVNGRCGCRLALVHRFLGVDGGRATSPVTSRRSNHTDTQNYFLKCPLCALEAFQKLLESSSHFSKANREPILIIFKNSNIFIIQ